MLAVPTEVVERVKTWECTGNSAGDTELPPCTGMTLNALETQPLPRRTKVR